MFSFRTTSFFEQPDLVLKRGKLGVLCNQTAWNPERGEYLFESVAKMGKLTKVFMPEHGLFGELQDQVKLNSGDGYNSLLEGVEFISLYGNNEESLAASLKDLTEIDALIVELQDVGCRYYTYLSTIFNLFKVLKANEVDLPVYIIDRINPAGRQVEGTALRPGYGSFIGIEGLVHRHGLTIGETSYMLYNEINAKFPLHIISYKASAVNKDLMPWSIPPSPNFPGLFTSHFYSGQCLWEGTNVSEGRGTTRPFEMFGAPYMEELSGYCKKNGLQGWNDPKCPIADEGVFVRWMRFIPTFHKWKDECCFGFQFLPNPNNQYHALAHNLRVIRFLHDNCAEFQFRPGKYEAGNDKTAIELLLGDQVLLDYVAGNGDWHDIKEHIKVEEQKWIRKAKKALLYEDEQLYRIK